MTATKIDLLSQIVFNILEYEKNLKQLRMRTKMNMENVNVCVYFITPK